MKPGLAPVVLSAGLALSVAGCATKRHVRESIAPLQNQANQTQGQVNAVQEQIEQNHEHIGDLDRRLAIAGEKATDATSQSEASLRVARQAADTASEAAQRAAGAGAAAQQAQRDLVRTSQKIDETAGRLNSYRLAFSEKIYFPFSQSVLTGDEREKLDLALRRLRGMKNYVIEVQGFADNSGDVGSNRLLSRKRADAVVHYMVVQHGVPLRFVWQLGAGADFPNADNQTPNARRQNRRVDIRVYSLDAPAPATAIADGAQP